LATGTIAMKPRPLVFACAAAMVVGLPTRGIAVAAGRDWSEVQLAWRDDPRPPADAPFEAEVPRGRRETRRAQRRGAVRRMPLDDVPVDVSKGAARAPLGQPLPWLPTNPAAERSDEPVIHRDQPSVPHPDSRQRFDILLPAGCAGGSRLPLVVWIHGDTWRDGSKADCPIRWLAERGYAVASVGYRLSDTATFPAQLDDCRAAVESIAGNAAVWGIDCDRIAVVGSGGGGHLAALFGLSEPEGIAAIAAIAAPSHLTTLGAEHDRPSSPASQLVGGPLPEFREAAQAASPLAHVSAGDPPCLVVHGERDEQVPLDQGVKLDAALRAAGVDSTLVVLEGAGHKPSLDCGSAAGNALLEFLDRTLAPNAAEPRSVIIPAAR
jgi:acetyl esterase/lipase